MRDELYIETANDAILVSVDVVNNISQDLIARVDNAEELDELVISKFNETEARKEALKMAYREIPIPTGFIPIETRREMQEKRNNLVEEYYIKIISQY